MVYTGPLPGGPLRHVLNTPQLNIRPDPGGRVAIHCRAESLYGSHSKNATEPAGVITAAARWLPGLAGTAPRETRVGIRPVPPGGPIVGFHPSLQGLYVAVSHAAASAWGPLWRQVRRQRDQPARAGTRACPVAAGPVPRRAGRHDRRRHCVRLIVVGSGVVGSGCAYAAAALGAEVTLIDSDRAGRATAAGAGIICPWSSGAEDPDWYALACAAARAYPSLIASLNEAGETAVGYRQVGAMTRCPGRRGRYARRPAPSGP